VRIGDNISLNGNNTHTSGIKRAIEREGKIYVETQTSVYEISIDEEVGTKVLTKKDLDVELGIFNTKKYGEWDMFNGPVPYHDDPYYLVLKNGEFNEGDRVTFFVERERSGVIQKSGNGGFKIVDYNGNPWGIRGILDSNGGYIKKAV
jgi:hypothetical protein